MPSSGSESHDHQDASGGDGQDEHQPSHGSMGKRGVSRPMAQQEQGHDHHGQQGHGGHGGGMHEMSQEDRLSMLNMHHQQTLWVYWTIVLLGVWMFVSPLTLGYGNPQLWVDPSGGRGVWFSDQTHTALRATLMIWSDIICGALLLVFGWRSLTPNRPVSLWVCCFVGIWLTMAPLFFWSPTAVAYLNDTVVGALLIALTILIPGMPNMVMYMQMGPPTPPGWSYNPSSWPQRWIMIVLGFAGWLVSRYLGAFQLGYITHAWDPFFGDSTQLVLNSNMSHMWPVSDAALGTAAYTLEFLMGYMGSPARWRTMPWMVAFFGILVIPLGLAHILLVISQPLIVGYWCTLCLLAAAIMLPMIPLEVDEVIAMGQHMVEAKRRGDREGSLWQVFWRGGSAEGCTPDERSPELAALPKKPADVFVASIWGMSFPWTLGLASALGIWLMFSPSAFGADRPASNLDHLVGALIVTVSVIAMGEPLRVARYLNILLGLIMVVAPWLLGGATTASAINGTLIGAAVIVLAIPRGPKSEQYGLWDKYVR